MTLKVSDKEAIRQAVMEKTFGARRAKCDEAHLAWSNLVYNDVFDENERALMQRLKTTRDGYVIPHRYLRVKIERPGEKDKVAEAEWPKEGETIPLQPYRNREKYTVMKVYDASSEIARLYEEITDTALDLKREEQAFDVQIRPIIWKANTHKQLREMWPELKDFVKHELLYPAPKPQLPAVQVSGINTIIASAIKHAEKLEA